MEDNNQPVIHLVARTFKPEEEDRQNAFYEKWFYEAYIPLLGEVTGLRSANRYKIVKDNPRYPKYLHIFRFDNLKSFQQYNNSPELTAIRQSVDANFPGNDYSWFVQYQQTLNWHKT